MKLLGRDDLKALLDSPADTSVSIYLPTERTGDIAQAAIRLRNLLREAEEKLLAAGVRQPDVVQMLDKARALADDTLFWHHQADALAVFLGPHTFTYFRLPHRVDEMVVVNKRFHVSPLLPLFTADGVFYVLGLSQKKIRLLQCTRDGAREVVVEGLPSNLADFLGYDEYSRETQFHTGPQQGASGRGTAIYHGHGEGKDVDKDNIARFLLQVDRGLHDTLKEERAPLVLAGVGFMRALFREQTTYAHVLEEGVEGNPDLMSPADLQTRAWPIVSAYFAQDRQAALSRYGDGLAHGLTANVLHDILLAARDGRVAALFVVSGAQEWGVAGDDTHQTIVHAAFTQGDEDLVDVAVARALLTGAAVYVVEPGQLPGGELIAALLRY